MDITFSTPNCGEIPLLAVQGVREVTAAANPGHTSNNSAAPDSVPAPATGDNSTQTTHNTSSTLTPSPGSAEDTYSDAHVLNATASVTRLVTLAGLRKGNISFTLQVANDTTGVPIPVDASASVVQAEVSRLLRSSSSTRDGVSAALPPLGNAHLEHPPVTVTRSGSCAAGYVWTVTYTAFYGPAPDLHVADSAQLENATADRRTPTLTVDQTTSKSMLRLRPIPGALTRSVHSDPQVVVHINGHSATCNATNPRDARRTHWIRDADCSFDFSAQPLLG